MAIVGIGPVRTEAQGGAGARLTGFRDSISLVFSAKENAAMKQLFLGLVLTVGFAASAHSQITGSLGGSYFSDYRGVELGAVVGSIGYRAGGDGGFSFQPEVRVGLGVTGDEIRGITLGGAEATYDVDLDNLVGAAARVQYQVPGGAYFFVQPTMARVNLKADYALQVRTLNDAEWDFGGDVGAGLMVTDGLGLEGSVGVMDGDSVYSAAIRLYF